MEENNVIEVRNVTKKFKIYHDKGMMLKERAISWKRNKYEERMVLNGISFNIKKGEAVGLIGQNGCGKSTTLKLLTKIMYQTSGSIDIKGRVSSLLELGAGFHPDLSGRENIYINASIFGLTKLEIDKRIEDIIEFSELENFIDNPVRTYSSGMYMRLAFSVAINVDADILLIDEILAVGDVNFQKKCLEKLIEKKNKGTTIVLVSHSPSQIESICDRSIWIDQGKIQCQGHPNEVYNKYLAYMNDKNDSLIISEQADNIELISVKIINQSGECKEVFENSETIILEIEIKPIQAIRNFDIHIGLMRNDGVLCYEFCSTYDNKWLVEWNNEHIVKLSLKDLPILPEIYYFDINIIDLVGKSIFKRYHIAEFEISGDRKQNGLFYINHNWDIQENI